MTDSLNAWTAIPAHLRPGLARYLISGIEPGGFLSAVLKNDLRGAVLRQSPGMGDGIKPTLMFLIRHIPATAHGSAENFAAWIQHRQRHPKESFMDFSDHQCLSLMAREATGELEASL